MSDLWSARLTPFATAIGLSLDELSRKLEPLVGKPDDEALSALLREDLSPFDDVARCLPGVPTARLRKALQELRAGGPAKAGPGVLPTLPDDASFSEGLVTGGVSKVSTNDVVAAARVSLASRVGLYAVPERLRAMLTQHAEAMSEPAPEVFYEIERLLSQRGAGVSLSALGIAGAYTGEDHRRRLVERFAPVWAGLSSLHGEVTAWRSRWNDSWNNPGGLAQVIVGAFSGGGAGAPPPPDTGPLRDQARRVVDQVNRALAGTGIVAARALAVEAMQIRSLLDHPGLPSCAGVTGREELLARVGVKVTAEHVRLESAAVRYLLSALALPQVAGEGELDYVTALLELGGTIAFDRLVDGLPSNKQGPKKF